MDRPRTVFLVRGRPAADGRAAHRAQGGGLLASPEQRCASRHRCEPARADGVRGREGQGLGATHASSGRRARGVLGDMREDASIVVGRGARWRAHFSVSVGVRGSDEAPVHHELFVGRDEVDDEPAHRRARSESAVRAPRLPQRRDVRGAGRTVLPGGRARGLPRRLVHRSRQEVRDRRGRRGVVHRPRATHR